VLNRQLRRRPSPHLNNATPIGFMKFRERPQFIAAFFIARTSSSVSGGVNK